MQIPLDALLSCKIWKWQDNSSTLGWTKSVITWRITENDEGKVIFRQLNLSN